MPSIGPIIATAGASLAGIGTVAWTNPDRVVASDNSRSSAGIGTSAVSLWLVATFANLAIPSDAIVLGVTGTVEIIGGVTAGTISAASFVVGNAVVGTQKALAIAYTTSEANYTVGGDLWGYPITPAVLNAAGTGFAISCTGPAGVGTVNVDAMWITVTYMQAGRVMRTRRVRRVNRH